ncbi:MAG TPA: hypothetical protein VFB78_10695 [Acidimicrobiales bacterium]|nr:hypothetical protein [Acidimicrobiales bacterium]
MSPTRATGSTPFGFTENIVTYADTPRALADIDPDGIWRFSISWAETQPHCSPSDQPALCLTPKSGPNDFVWTKVDHALDAAAATHVKVLPNLLQAPRWAQSSTETTCCQPAVMPPRDDGTGVGWWADWVGYVMNHILQRYPGGVVGIEIWNEQNTNGFWTVSGSLGGPNPARYKKLLCSAYSKVKSYAPTMPVAIGGLVHTTSSTQPTTTRLSVTDFLDGLWAAGGGGCYDVLNIHASPHAVDTQSPSWNFPEFVNEPTQWGVAHGQGGLDLWLTEAGLPWPTRSTKPPTARRYGTRPRRWASTWCCSGARSTVALGPKPMITAGSVYSPAAQGTSPTRSSRMSSAGREPPPASRGA